MTKYTIFLFCLITTAQNTTVDEWISDYDLALSSQQTLINGYADSDGADQEHYYLAWPYSGILSAYRAKGRAVDLHRIFDIPMRMIDNSVQLNTRREWGSNRFQGWPATKTGNVNVYGQGLWESYIWRYVATMLRLTKDKAFLAQDNGALAGTTYQDSWNTIFNFIETNIWEKWYTYASNGEPVFRVNTHMSSHWARLGIEMYTLTGEQKYLTHFQQISFFGMPSTSNYSGSNLRAQFSVDNGAYEWGVGWGGTPMQDGSHAADMISFFVESYELGAYWNATDITRLSNTLRVMWTQSSPPALTFFVDGTGDLLEIEATFGDWYTLARHDSNIMARVQTSFTSYNTTSQRRTLLMGTAALSQAYQDNNVFLKVANTNKLNKILLLRKR